MKNITFVCLGNICRSPMAEAIFTRLAGERGVLSLFNVRSFATSSYEVGNPVYPPAASALRRHGITDFTHFSRQLTAKDIADSDCVLVMDGMNLADVTALARVEDRGKIRLLGSYLHPPREIADPYYTRDFERAWSDISSACAALLDSLLQEK